MLVKQIFNFSDGRTILAEVVEGGGKIIQPGRYGLYENEYLIHEVEVEGEMIPKASNASRSERAVSIKEQIGLPSGTPQKQLTLSPMT